MKCPKCEDGKIFKFKANKTGAHALAPTKCKHCHGTGKIKFHSVWMCKIIKHDITLPLICEEIFWCHGIKYWDVDEVEPIARMEEIE